MLHARQVAGVTIRFTAQGGRFQGSIDSSGVVRAGAPGTMPVAILATVPGGAPYLRAHRGQAAPGPGGSHND